MALPEKIISARPFLESYEKALSPMPRQMSSCLLHFFDKFRFQAHGAETIDLAVDVMIAIYQTDVAHPGTHFDHARGALEFQILGYGDRITIHQDTPKGIAIDLVVFFRLRRCLYLHPFVRAFRADAKPAVFVGKF